MKRNGLYSAVRGFAAAGLALGCLAPVAVAQKTTTSQGNGNWNAIAWDNGAPAAGDTVYIDHTVEITNSPPDLAALTVNAAREFKFTGWSNTVLTATVVDVSGTVTHSDNWLVRTNAVGQWVPSNRVHIVCSDLTIDSGGRIHADEKGYARADVLWGYGPGGARNGAGASHGGKGGAGLASTAISDAGLPYGSVSEPEDPGSGGGKWGGWGVGTSGGGAIRIEASGDVTVNGAITANGGDSVNFAGGRGSGGSVWITCNTILGSGTIGAKGGAVGPDNTYAGGGGGGRIAVHYNPAAQSSVSCAVTFSAWASPTGFHYEVPSNFGMRPDLRSELGTLYFPDAKVFPRDLMAGDSGRPVIPGFTNWAPDSLVLDNGWIMFPSNFTLAVSGDVTVQGSLGRLELDADTECSIDGNLMLTNGGALVAYCGLTATNLDHSVLVHVARDVRILTNSTIYAYSHPTNGGSALFTMRDLTIDSGGAINADGKGYRGANSDDTHGGWGYGPGAGFDGRGGSYGGVGGRSLYGTTGYGTYGSSNAPAHPGSGSGMGGGYAVGGNGGGLIRVEASRTVTVNGTITANGHSGVTVSGGGSGGGIYVLCKTFAGGGIVRANGGDAPSSNGGAGGGGRVAIWRVYDTSTLSVLSADAGAGGHSAPYAESGTVVLGQLQPSGMLITIR